MRNLQTQIDEVLEGVDRRDPAEWLKALIAGTKDGLIPQVAPAPAGWTSEQIAALNALLIAGDRQARARQEFARIEKESMMTEANYMTPARNAYRRAMQAHVKQLALAGDNWVDEVLGRPKEKVRDAERQIKEARRQLKALDAVKPSLWKRVIGAAADWKAQHEAAQTQLAAAEIAADKMRYEVRTRQRYLETPQGKAEKALQAESRTVWSARNVAEAQQRLLAAQRMCRPYQDIRDELKRAQDALALAERNVELPERIRARFLEAPARTEDKKDWQIRMERWGDEIGPIADLAKRGPVNRKKDAGEDLDPSGITMR